MSINSRIEGILRRMGCEFDGLHWRSKELAVGHLVNVMAAVGSQHLGLMGAYL